MCLTLLNFYFWRVYTNVCKEIHNILIKIGIWQEVPELPKLMKKVLWHLSFFFSYSILYLGLDISFRKTLFFFHHIILFPYVFHYFSLLLIKLQFIEIFLVSFGQEMFFLKIRKVIFPTLAKDDFTFLYSFLIIQSIDVGPSTHMDSSLVLAYYHAAST